eukprot:CAMPEP_0171328760 /NCGR_PEP_ID=MMETSP0878-20121228/840_1 /TAXON_ID=67004 /ORGANISM="Thalassiosira weissflogii, Strain CCMP1336" /LENGTH=164 /DNA_ID=CAMNT_0011828637 /DNA_START=40 /DNA_END=534 /DNA_ORIENTATION=+
MNNAKNTVVNAPLSPVMADYLDNMPYFDTVTPVKSPSYKPKNKSPGCPPPPAHRRKSISDVMFESFAIANADSYNTRTPSTKKRSSEDISAIIDKMIPPLAFHKKGEAGLVRRKTISILPRRGSLVSAKVGCSPYPRGYSCNMADMLSEVEDMVGENEQGFEES